MNHERVTYVGSCLHTRERAIKKLSRSHLYYFIANLAISPAATPLWLIQCSQGHINILIRRICGQSLWEQPTILPRVHTDPAVLINAGCRLSQEVDVVAGLLHVEQEEDWDGGEGKHCKPDEGQDVCHYDKLLKEKEGRFVSLCGQVSESEKKIRQTRIQCLSLTSSSPSLIISTPRHVLTVRLRQRPHWVLLNSPKVCLTALVA